MKRALFSVSVLVLLVTQRGSAAEVSAPVAPSTPARSGSANDASPKPNDSVRVDAGVVVKPDVTGANAKPDQGTTVLMETEAAKKERLRKEKDSPVEAAKVTEAQKASDDATALSRGEGERYLARLKAYEAARAGTGRTAVEPTRKTSIAQAQLPNGRYVVIAGGDRREFATKAEADAFVDEIKLEEFNRPIVIK